jgi:hypothetical protein
VSRYREFLFEVDTPHGKVSFRCRVKSEAAAIAARDAFVARMNGANKPLHERLSRRGPITI